MQKLNLTLLAFLLFATPINIFAATTLPSATTFAATQPHIVYILADDMSPGDIQTLNPTGKIPTPNLDRLVKQGLAFTQAYSGSAICTPTRYGIMTGRYCWRDRIGLASGYSAPFIDSQTPTVAQFLLSQGYRTRMVGKWHLGGTWTGVNGSQLPLLKTLTQLNK